MNLTFVIIATLLLAVPHWTLQKSNVTSRLRGSSAVNSRVAWASGSNSTVLRTIDGGTTWTKISVTTDKLDFRDIDAVNAQTAYVLSIGNGEASRIYKTTDAGATWTLQFKNGDPKAFYDAMSFWDADHGIVVGDSIDGQFCILTTSNGGRDWIRTTPDSLPEALPSEGAFAASGTNIALFGKLHAWIGTGGAAKGRVLRTTDRGRTWSIAETPLSAGSSTGIFSIAFRDARHGIVVGGDYTKEGEAVDNMAVTSDGGVTWSLRKGLSGYRSVVAYQPGPRGNTMSIVAVGPSGSDYSTDDGVSWRRVEGPGFDTLSFSRTSGKSAPVGWGAGKDGAIGLLTLK